MSTNKLKRSFDMGNKEKVVALLKCIETGEFRTGGVY